MSEQAAEKSDKKSNHSKQRTTARLAAVQAIYQMDLTKSDINQVRAEFASHWKEGAKEAGLVPAQMSFFHKIVQGVLTEQIKIDQLVQKILKKDWPLVRLEILLRALLRCGTYELLFNENAPPKVVIAEYVQISEAFYDKKETGLVNAVLHEIKTQLEREGLETILGKS